jgi:enoyl-CoA hydratase/carnithine racemase
MQAASYETLLVTTADRICRITLNRPDKRNSLNPRMLEELATAFAAADADPAVAVIVLRGAGEQAFCAGADLGEMGGGDGIYASYQGRGLFPRLFMTMEKLQKPTLAAVNGACVAGGFGLMMACDLAIAKSAVKLGTPEIARGLFPYMISALILRSVPRRKAFELMLLGDTFSSDQALEWGVVNKTVPAEQFDAAVEEWAKKIAGYSPAVLALGRRALVQQAGMPLDGAFDYLQGLLTVNSMMEDAVEGISAFFDKRPPSWKGK